MENRSIARNIRDTGFALRDWLGPYYMLGGAVAFGITMLTLLDPTGWLVRAVGAALLTLTLVAWACHLHVQRRRPAALAVQQSHGPDGGGPATAHSILLAVTLFFLCGIVVSESFLAHQRAAAAREAQSTATPATPATPAAVVGSAPATPARAAGGPGLDEADRAPASTAPVQPLATEPRTAPPPPDGASPPGTPAAGASATGTVDPGPASSVAPGRGAVSATAFAAVPVPVTVQASPSRAPASAQVQPQQHQSPAAPAPTTPAARRRPAGQPQHADAGLNALSLPAARPPQTAQQQARCTELLSRFSLGETLQPSDRQYLGNTCH